MKGKHHIIIEAPRLKYEFTIKRNITIIRGESATGKTTLIDLLADYRTGDTAIRIESDVPCRVFTDNSDTWRQTLDVIENSIIFFDEDQEFIRKKDFADCVKGSTNYFVLITRDCLPELPYSICEIYGIRTSGKYHFPEQIYHEFYPLYSEVSNGDDLPLYENMSIVTEDSRSGYQFFRSYCTDTRSCVSAQGNAGILQTMIRQSEDILTVVIADGAAFGSYIENVLEYAKLRQNFYLYFPESFEWIILKSGVVSDGRMIMELEKPEDYISGEEFMSWEQFFNELLIKMTQDDEVRSYRKNNLNSFYIQGNVKEKIENVFPNELRRILRDMQ